MPSRLIAVSNRIPAGEPPSGGLVVALKDALALSGGLWIGAHPETGTGREPLEEIQDNGNTHLAFRLSEDDLSDYYLGYANSVLWPLCHRRVDLIDMSAAFEARYRAVNARVGRMIASIARPEDVIWVHDYHFFPLASELRALGLSNRIGFFLHIPFPELGSLSVLSQPEDFSDWLASYNLVGLQTRADVARCLEVYRADPRAEFLVDGSVKFEDRVTEIRSFPIGIDVEDFRTQAARDAPDPFGRAAPESFVIGVDRLDYSKGIPNRFRAFGRYLETRPEGSYPCLVQIAPPTREQVQAYQDITSELEEIAGHLNGAFAELDWVPIRYIHRSIDRTVLARLHRRARVCAVTSIADGMNLVAKEFVAAQDPADPGVLILSRFAGAAEDMTDALLVNPYDIDDMTEAYRRAFAMPLEERQARHTACMEVVQRTDAASWAKQFLAVLRACVPTLPRQVPSPRRPASKCPGQTPMKA
ncbi:trehalose 6-phosphate synthase [Lutimaribacter pacificus]|uniref:Trehalose 6-phosphate synthase n=1 Tax=Lutimaribacter pacificus TaxID=391948 RepID=A0A1H0LUG1_9RHOB|nr:trehalose-6-phosphate synthase [Lutimaribacter pacificus]SDO71802.1 trehalose 6-phosphate synthase [Lutimaribacter pacificus]SHK03132.1 trehalose 6-phosphate synthase [Lutimaribacter pacificus]